MAKLLEIVTSKSAELQDVQLLTVGHGGLCPNSVVQRTCQTPFTGIVKINQKKGGLQQEGICCSM